MSYFHYIDNGEGPVKLFIGGVHGKEGETSSYFLEKLKKEDFAEGQIYIYNFDSSKYISTLKKEYYESDVGSKIISLIKEINPDFYVELHCYDIRHFNKLTSINRFKTQGVPPLIDIGDFILISSVSPLIRTKYFTRKTVCKTLEFPCFNKLDNNLINEYNFNKEIAIEKYEDFIKLLALSTSRKDFTNKIKSEYPIQTKLAIKYAKEIFGKLFPPF
ncbi:DUF2119 domain-containing protein [Methanobrevibacter sp. OttesenSCG-928-K11]|nr:DUF2119 domain-containing protein [Methanobrevibacter sp. OttesenSCG-928-K11]